MIFLAALALIATAQPNASPAPAPKCLRNMQGAVISDHSHSGSSKGAAPYYAVVEMHLNADDSVKWVRIYKSSGIPDYDNDALLVARTMLTIPEIAHCAHIESDFFYVHYPQGYDTPQFAPARQAQAAPAPPASGSPLY